MVLWLLEKKSEVEFSVFFLWTAAVSTVVCQNSFCPFSKKQIKKATWWFLLLFILSTEESRVPTREKISGQISIILYVLLLTNLELPLQNNSCHTYLLYWRLIYEMIISHNKIDWKATLLQIWIDYSKQSAAACTQCLKITQNVAFEFFNFGIFHQFLSD